VEVRQFHFPARQWIKITLIGNRFVGQVSPGTKLAIWHGAYDGTIGPKSDCITSKMISGWPGLRTAERVSEERIVNPERGSYCGGRRNCVLYGGFEV
jgi:hypothetical protein